MPEVENMKRRWEVISSVPAENIDADEENEENATTDNNLSQLALDYDNEWLLFAY